MHVVDVRDALGMGGEIVGDGVAVDVRRRAFEQDQPGFAHEPPGAADQEKRDEHRKQRVGRQSSRWPG